MGSKTEFENVERLEMMEDECDITLSGLYAEYEAIGHDYKYIYVRGEIQPQNGTTIDQDLDIVVTVYNSKGQVIATCSDSLYADDFFGISPFDISVEVIEKPAKIKVYPKPS